MSTYASVSDGLLFPRSRLHYAAGVLPTVVERGGTIPLLSQSMLHPDLYGATAPLISFQLSGSKQLVYLSRNSSRIRSSPHMLSSKPISTRPCRQVLTRKGQYILFQLTTSNIIYESHTPWRQPARRLIQVADEGLAAMLLRCSIDDGNGRFNSMCKIMPFSSIPCGIAVGEAEVQRQPSMVIDLVDLTSAQPGLATRSRDQELAIFSGKV
ncbi:uncharacterized protein BCR38DRAFT_102128 [Pseudomassariella vexata]|uniref:Uncharacterized protein n=1 Tax=Pseudomassariella vexata TaxID=1141098 RepID=A0A1Y2EFX3_9PEZI|nr:uncharacterized protein BCR38DRAFT_102128 [Pseudomassariella vexata]ORY70204.1 hypothetical protein BCR38DRAFT_102128 [Pseudomassariella vexata]